MINVTVPVPDDRIAEFYQFLGRWLDGSLSHPLSHSGAIEGPPEAAQVAQLDLTPWSDTEQDFADAEALWRKYSAPAARAMFSLLVDNPDEEYTGEQIAQTVNIPNGAHGVAGVLSWPARHGHAIGRGLPAGWRQDQETQQSFYWMPARTAGLFRAARATMQAGN